MPTINKVNRGYQITIPKQIRKELGINVGDYLSVEMRNGEILMKPVEVVPKTASEESRRFWAEIDQGGTLGVTEEEIADEVRRIRAEKRKSA